MKERERERERENATYRQKNQFHSGQEIFSAVNLKLGSTQGATREF